MPPTMNAEKNKRIRIALLELLKTEYPGSLDLRVLKFSLDNLGYPMLEGDLTAQLRYLEERGYAKLQKKEGYGFSIAFVKLTADGWDLIDGHRHEAGIDEAL
jgi:hypothetical protein